MQLVSTVNRGKRPKLKCLFGLICLFETLMRCLMQIPVEIGVCCVGIKRGSLFGGQKFDLIGRAEFFKCRLGHDQLDRDIRIADGELEFDQAIGQRAHDANELARDVEIAFCNVVSLLVMAPLKLRSDETY